MSYWDPVSWNNNWLVDISGTTIIVPSSYGSFSRPIKILWEPYYTDFSAKLSTIQWRIFTNKTLLHDFGFCPNLSTVSLSHLVFSIKGYQLKKNSESSMFMIVLERLCERPCFMGLFLCSAVMWLCDKFVTLIFELTPTVRTSVRSPHPHLSQRKHSDRMFSAFSSLK